MAYGQKRYCSIRDRSKARIPPGYKIIARSICKGNRNCKFENFYVRSVFLIAINPPFPQVPLFQNSEFAIKHNANRSFENDDVQMNTI